MLRRQVCAVVAAVLAFALHGLAHRLLQLLVGVGARTRSETRLRSLGRRFQLRLIVLRQWLSGRGGLMLLSDLTLGLRRRRCGRCGLLARLRSRSGRRRATHRLQLLEGLLVERGVRRLGHAVLIGNRGRGLRLHLLQRVGRQIEESEVLLPLLHDHRRIDDMHVVDVLRPIEQIPGHDHVDDQRDP